MPVIVHRLARAEVRRAAAYHHRRSPAVASRFLASVDDAIARAVANPGVGAPTATGHRGVKTKRFKYVVYYRSPTPGLVEVFAVAHASRRPGYWLGRTRRP